MELSGSEESSVWVYMSGLMKHDYVQRRPSGWVLLQDTGPHSPAYSAQTGELHDWNLNPRMSPATLTRAWKRSGLSVSAFAEAIGFNRGSSARVASMMRGGRPVSAQVENAVNEYLKKSGDAHSGK